MSSQLVSRCQPSSSPQLYSLTPGQTLPEIFVRVWGEDRRGENRRGEERTGEGPQSSPGASPARSGWWWWQARTVWRVDEGEQRQAAAASWLAREPPVSAGVTPGYLVPRNRLSCQETPGLPPCQPPGLLSASDQSDDQGQTSRQEDKVRGQASRRALVGLLALKYYTVLTCFTLLTVMIQIVIVSQQVTLWRLGQSKFRTEFINILSGIILKYEVLFYL